MHDVIAAQDAIVDEFSLFPDWLDKYQYLIDLGRKLEPLAASDINDDNLLDGCQSRVWLVIEESEGIMTIRASSDAAIVSGLIALLIRVFSGASPRQVAETEPYFIDKIGLSSHLSPTRANGLHAMLTAIRTKAELHLS